MTDTIAEVIAQVNAAGYYFNNLFQLQTGQWRCNLRSDIMIPSHTDYGTGQDPETAVAEALRKMLADNPRPSTGGPDNGDLQIPAFLKRQPKTKPAPRLTSAETGDPTDDLIGGSDSNNDDLVG